MKPYAARCPGESRDPSIRCSCRRQMDPGFWPGKRSILSVATNLLVSCEFPHRPSGRPALDETVRGPLSRRKPRPIYPLLVPATDGPRLLAGEAFNIVCRHEPPCFLRVPHRPSSRPALHETVRGPLSRRKPRPIYPLLVPATDGPRLLAGEAFNIVCRHEPPCFLRGAERRSNLGEFGNIPARDCFPPERPVGPAVRGSLAMTFPFNSEASMRPGRGVPRSPPAE